MREYGRTLLSHYLDGMIETLQHDRIVVIASVRRRHGL